MKKIGIALLGTGWVAERHIRAFQQSGRFRVIGGCKGKHRHDELDRFCRQWGISPYRSYEELLESKDVEAVAILTPTSLHFEQAMRAIEAGKHVLLEKPVALDISQIDTMIKATKDSGLVIFPAHNFIYRPVIIKAKELIEAGKLGTISYASFRSIHFLAAPDGWRKDLRIAGGGALIDSGMHLVYQSTYLMGRPTRLVAFKAKKHYLQLEGEDIAQISLTYPNAEIGQIVQSWACGDRSASEILVLGNQGSLLITDGLYINGRRIEDDWEYERSFVHLARAFAQAVQNATPPVSDIHDARICLEIVQKAYQSARMETVCRL
jgi:predicted dehydrogenase